MNHTVDPKLHVDGAELGESTVLSIGKVASLKRLIGVPPVLRFI